MAPTHASSDAVVARLLLPDDANPAGNVHGGTILRLMEEAGVICARRFMRSSGETSVAALVRFENMSFHQPMYVGEVASLSARVIFTSPHSICVNVDVTAENLCGGETRTTNSGQLWYVPLVASPKDGWKNPVVNPAPQLTVPVDGVALQEYNEALQAYIARKYGMNDEEECSTTPGCLSLQEFQASYKNVEHGGTPAESEQTLCQMTLPGDCEPLGFCYGGFVMKLMDNAAACSAFRHCHTNVVTVGISALDFVHWIRLGDICTIHSRVVFASNKTLEIQVTAHDTSLPSNNSNGGAKDDVLVAKGMFVFASLNKDGKSISVPPLKLETRNDYQEAYLGKLRYDMAKRARMAAKSPVKRLFSTFASSKTCSTLPLARSTSSCFGGALLVHVGALRRRSQARGKIWQRLGGGVASRCLGACKMSIG
jgi:acyl-coenzyme A thioesterase 7